MRGLEWKNLIEILEDVIDSTLDTRARMKQFGCLQEYHYVSDSDYLTNWVDTEDSFLGFYYINVQISVSDRVLADVQS